MAEVVLPTGEAVELTTLNPEISAYIAPVTFFPTGMAFEIVAELARPQRGQIMPYYVSARLRIATSEYEIGGGTQASADTAHITFWLPADAITGGMAEVRRNACAIDIYEGSDRRTATTNRTLVQTVAVAGA